MHELIEGFLDVIIVHIEVVLPLCLLDNVVLYSEALLVSSRDIVEYLVIHLLNQGLKVFELLEDGVLLTCLAVVLRSHFFQNVNYFFIFLVLYSNLGELLGFELLEHLKGNIFRCFHLVNQDVYVSYIYKKCREVPFNNLKFQYYYCMKLHVCD